MPPEHYTPGISIFASFETCLSASGAPENSNVGSSARLFRKQVSLSESFMCFDGEVKTKLTNLKTQAACRSEATRYLGICYQKAIL